eukprot:6133032-Lingulodinium_polyedra.AAC.1
MEGALAAASGSSVQWPPSKPLVPCNGIARHAERRSWMIEQGVLLSRILLTKRGAAASTSGCTG